MSCTKHELNPPHEAPQAMPRCFACCHGHVDELSEDEFVSQNTLHQIPLDHAHAEQSRSGTSVAWQACRPGSSLTASWTEDVASVEASEHTGIASQLSYMHREAPTHVSSGSRDGRSGQ